jgi:hypothetical protein
MNYLVNHREPLSRFLEEGRLRLDNNLSELELRRQRPAPRIEADRRGLTKLLTTPLLGAKRTEQWLDGDPLRYSATDLALLCG